MVKIVFNEMVNKLTIERIKTKVVFMKEDIFHKPLANLNKRGGIYKQYQ